MTGFKGVEAKVKVSFGEKNINDFSLLTILFANSRKRCEIVWLKVFQLDWVTDDSNRLVKITSNNSLNSVT